MLKAPQVSSFEIVLNGLAQAGVEYQDDAMIIPEDTPCPSRC
jgi:hypothetical protein